MECVGMIYFNLHSQLAQELQQGEEGESILQGYWLCWLPSFLCGHTATLRHSKVRNENNHQVIWRLEDPGSLY